MDGQWAVVVGAALGASGAVVGALTSWASARLQARAHVNVARLQQSAAHDAETTARRRAAYSDLILSVDTARRQMRIVRQHVCTADPGDDELQTKQATVHDRIREMQAAEWVLRLMLSDDEQAAVTDLTNAVYASHHALIEDVDEWLQQASADGARTPSGTPRYDGKTSALQAQMMSFAGSAHARLYA
ncbi:hypothetical protein HHX38_04660 [Streptomyces sp. PKU-MA01144]|uniref:hypothetical protein n=1 Tax=Streptomyces sp. PKU-MA01144 TaxID=2729138 RepID=UPI001480AA47|nr:hypothetical protein [Streptomyces sp. PKU-MA01144]NNJ03430.1 hypothetical protein [Streptomyces sp. PKU-MA01144]